MPAFSHGRNTVVYYRGYNLGQYLKEVNWASEIDTPETTAFGSTTRSYVVGFPSITVTGSGMYSSAIGATALPEVDNFMDASMGNAVSGWLLYGPVGGAVGSPAKTGYSDSTNYTVTGSVTDMVAISADFQVNADSVGNGTFWVDPLDTKQGNATHTWTLDRTAGEPTSGKTFRVWVQGLNTSDVSVTMDFRTSPDNSTYTTQQSSVAPARTPWNIAYTAVTLARYLRVSIVVAGATGTPVFSIAAVRWTSP
jgi:hypothetical protein